MDIKDLLLDAYEPAAYKPDQTKTWNLWWGSCCLNGSDIKASCGADK